jgi:hypothetical protein
VRWLRFWPCVDSIICCLVAGGLGLQRELTCQHIVNARRVSCCFQLDLVSAQLPRNYTLSSTPRKLRTSCEVNFPPPSPQDDLYAINLCHTVLTLRLLLQVLCDPHILNISHDSVPAGEPL